MPFIPIPDAALVRIKFVCGTYEATVGLWFTRAIFDATDLSDLLDALALGLCTDWAGVLHEDVTITLLEAIDMRARDGCYAMKSTSIAGTVSTGEPYAWGNAAVVTLKTAKRGRWHHGRIYIPGISESDADMAGPADGVMVVILGALSDLLDPGIPDWTPVVVSQVMDGEPREEGVTEPVTVYASRSQVWGFQRRRQRRE